MGLPKKLRFKLTILSSVANQVCSQSLQYKDLFFLKQKFFEQLDFLESKNRKRTAVNPKLACASTEANSIAANCNCAYEINITKSNKYFILSNEPTLKSVSKLCVHVENYG